MPLVVVVRLLLLLLPTVTLPVPVPVPLHPHELLRLAAPFPPYFLCVHARVSSFCLIHLPPPPPFRSDGTNFTPSPSPFRRHQFLLFLLLLLLPRLLTMRVMGAWALAEAGRCHRAGTRVRRRPRGGGHQRRLGRAVRVQHPLGWTRGLRTNRYGVRGRLENVEFGGGIVTQVGGMKQRAVLPLNTHRPHSGRRMWGGQGGGERVLASMRVVFTKK